MGEERIFVEGETATSLLEKLDPLTDVQARALMESQYAGKWIPVRGLVVDVSKDDWGISVSLALGGLRGVFLTFPSDATRPLELSKGDGVLAQGRITNGSMPHFLNLEQCDLLKVVPKAEMESRADATKEASEKDVRPAAQLTRAVSDEKPRLPNAALEAWFEAFKIAYPNGRQTLAEKSAAGAFPDHHISRNRIRELLPNSPKGRPKKNNDLDNSLESDGE